MIFISSSKVIMGFGLMTGSSAISLQSDRADTKTTDDREIFAGTSIDLLKKFATSYANILRSPNPNPLESFECALSGNRLKHIARTKLYVDTSSTDQISRGWFFEGIKCF